MQRRLSTKHPDYWDYATQLELEILADNEQQAKLYLEKLVTETREAWEPETTARNLSLIIQAREKRSQIVSWIKEIEKELIKLSEEME